MKKQKFQEGYIALLSVIVIGTLLVIIGISLSLASINQLQFSLASTKGHQTLVLVETCVEEALLSLNKTSTIASQITLPEGVCNVTMNSSSGNNYDFTVVATLDGHTKKVRVAATRDSSVTITSWSEQD